MAGHNLAGGATGNEENDWLNYTSNVSVIMTYRECMGMLIDKMHQAYLGHLVKMRMAGISSILIPILKIERSGLTASLDLNYTSQESRSHIVELSTSTLLRLGLRSSQTFSN